MKPHSSSAPRVPDLSWRKVGLFTLFLPNTPAGEDAWRSLAVHTEGTGKVFAHQAADVIRLLRAHGYTVGRLPARGATSAAEDAALAAQLDAPPQSPQHPSSQTHGNQDRDTGQGLA